MEKDSKTLNFSNTSKYIRWLHESFGHRVAERIQADKTIIEVWGIPMELGVLENLARRGALDKEFLRIHKEKNGVV